MRYSSGEGINAHVLMPSIQELCIEHPECVFSQFKSDPACKLFKADPGADQQSKLIADSGYTTSLCFQPYHNFCPNTELSGQGKWWERICWDWV